MMNQKETIEGPKPHEIATEIMAAARFVSFLDDDELWIEREGVLEPDGDKRVKAAVEKTVPDASDHFKNEVIAHIRDRTRQDRAKVDSESWPFLGVKNGVIDVRDTPPVFYSFEEFKHLFPSSFIFNKLPVEFRVGAKAPKFLKFLKELTPNHDDQIRLLDQFASILDRRPDRKQRCLMLVGPPDSGKTTFLNVEAALVGPKNLSAVPLQSLTDGTDRFATAALYGKMLNACGDLGEIPLKILGPFKDLTGGSVIRAQRKGRDSFEFHNHAKLHFAANVPPGVKNITDAAFWSRWDYIETNRRGEINPDLLNELTDPHEMSGVLNILLGILARQIRTAHFYFAPSPEETQAAWLGEAEPARRFLIESVIVDPNGKIPRRLLTAAWESWRAAHNAGRISNTRLNELVSDQFKACPGQAWFNGKNTKAWLGIKVKDGNNFNLTDFAPSGLTDSTNSLWFFEKDKKIKDISEKTVKAVRDGLNSLFNGGVYL